MSGAYRLHRMQGLHKWGVYHWSLIDCNYQVAIGTMRKARVLQHKLVGVDLIDLLPHQRKHIYCLHNCAVHELTYW